MFLVRWSRPELDRSDKNITRAGAATMNTEMVYHYSLPHCWLPPDYWWSVWFSFSGYRLTLQANLILSQAGMAIVFISLSRGSYNRVEQWVGTTIVHGVRVGPLFVLDNPFGEIKSPLKYTTSQASLPASQIDSGPRRRDRGRYPTMTRG
jgi:hypothetical protein